MLEKLVTLETKEKWEKPDFQVLKDQTVFKVPQDQRE